MNCVASQTYGNKAKTRLVSFSVLLFVSAFHPWKHSNQVLLRLRAFYIGVAEIINVKATAAGVWGQDCGAIVLPDAGINVLRCGRVSAQTATMGTELTPTETSCKLSAEQDGW